MTKNNQKILCPICSQESIKLYHLSQNYIASELKKYYKVNKIPNNIISTDYNMYRCKNCGLIFSEPLIPGNNEFYNWITLNSSYYNSERWEYKIVFELTNKIKENNKNLIDIGCGNGDFIKFLKNKININVIGIDPTQTSIRACKNFNLKCHCMTIDEFYSKYRRQKFDYITAFHVLEHVNNPKNFIIKILNLLKKNGKIFISTPCSPMSFEHDWYDPLNHPPHHMTRWNISAYKELSKQLNLNIKFFFPPKNNPIIRSIISVYFKFYGNTSSSFLRKTQKVLTKHPLDLIKNFIKQTKREHNNKTAANNLMLVQLSHKK